MTFKPLNENDAVNTRTLLHEAIPLTGSIVSGSYATAFQPDNVKSYSHGMFQSVYDYPYLSSSANHIFDMTCGVSAQTSLSITNMQAKKRNVYGQMAQVLMGYDVTGSVQLFDEDGDLLAGGSKLKETFVFPFSRLLVKDEIKKESFQMKFDCTTFVQAAQPFTELITITDHSASSEYRVNSPAGEYGILYATASTFDVLSEAQTAHMEDFGVATNPYWRCGLIFYQAGVVVLTGSLFQTLLGSAGTAGAKTHFDATGGGTVDAALIGDTIDDINYTMRHRLENIQFNNTTELNSTVYFCRVNHNEFNYSSNPTYLDNSKIRVKTQATDEPVSYITSVGLYNDRNELLATAKLSEALKKSPSTEFTIRARLDY
jgi:hypothetical protein